MDPDRSRRNLDYLFMDACAFGDGKPRMQPHELLQGPVATPDAGQAKAGQGRRLRDWAE